MLTEYEALLRRVSVRSFEKRVLEPPIVQELRSLTDEINSQSGLDFRLVHTGDASKAAVKLSGAMFSGSVSTCALLIGGADEISAEMVGYFGQKLVLRAVALGLGTCWVAGTFDRKSVDVELTEDRRLWSVIPLGYATAKVPLKQRTIRAAIRGKDRKLEQFIEFDHPLSTLPRWIASGVEAVKMGPSAVNQQPVNIVYKDGLVTARIWRENANILKYNDLGIAKYQFQVAAEAAGVRGFWNFGDGGEFIVDG